MDTDVYYSTAEIVHCHWKVLVLQICIKVKFRTSPNLSLKQVLVLSAAMKFHFDTSCIPKGLIIYVLYVKTACNLFDTGWLLVHNFLLILLKLQVALSIQPGAECTSTSSLQAPAITLIQVHILSKCACCPRAAPECLHQSNSYSKIPTQTHKHGVISLLVHVILIMPAGGCCLLCMNDSYNTYSDCHCLDCLDHILSNKTSCNNRQNSATDWPCEIIQMDQSELLLLFFFCM